MRDVHDRHPSLGVQAANQCVQPLALRRPERGRGLVQYEQAHPAADRTNDLDHRLIGDRQLSGRHPWVELDSHLRCHRSKLGAHLAKVDEGSMTPVAADEDVLEHAQLGEDRELLMNVCNPLPLCGEGIAERQRLPENLQSRAGIRCDRSRHDAHERRLPRAVFADEPVNRPGGYIEIHISQRPYSRVRLRHVTGEKGGGRDPGPRCSLRRHRVYVVTTRA